MERAWFKISRSLKTRGLIELNALRSRVRRQRNLGRISAPSEEWLVRELDRIEAFIIQMTERGNDLDV